MEFCWAVDFRWKESRMDSSSLQVSEVQWPPSLPLPLPYVLAQGKSKHGRLNTFQVNIRTRTVEGTLRTAPSSALPTGIVHVAASLSSLTGELRPNFNSTIAGRSYSARSTTNP